MILAALVTVTLWSSAFVGIRYAGRHFAPGPLALGRLVVGSVVLGALCWPGASRCRRGAR